MFCELLIALYRLVHGRLHSPGAGWLIRKLAAVLPGLQAYPCAVPEVGVALLDFREIEAFGMLNYLMGELQNNVGLYRWLALALQPGDVFWDVGANIGTVSAHFAHPRFRLSSLHAFEPNPGPLKTLQSLFSGNRRCHVHPFGLGDTDKTIIMHLSAAGSSVGSMSRDFHEGKEIEVRIRRGDNAVHALGIAPPSVIKIDVEGFESSVFSGLTETIAQHRPTIIFEHIFLSDDQIKALIPNEYSLIFIQDDGSTTDDFSKRSQGHDAIIIPVAKRTQFQLAPNLQAIT